MIEQRLQQRLRLLLTAPLALVLIVAAVAVTTARSPGAQPREAVFDTYQRLSPRPAAATPQVAVIDIDEESVARLGPWPWPRSALAELVTAAETANARSVVVAVPTEGPDPLSPEVLGRYWLAGGRMDPAAAAALGALPGTDVALAGAASGVPTALGVASRVPGTDEAPTWLRADATAAPWLTLAGEEGGFLALPAAASADRLPPALSSALGAVIGLPVDKDGLLRRTPLLWATGERPVPAAGFAPLAATAPVIAAPARGRLRVGGTPVSALAAEDVILPLDTRSEMRLWLPANLDVDTVPAWRVLTGGAQWTGPLEGRDVFIGQSVTQDATAPTPRGPLRLAQAHALIAEQARAGAAPVRPGWAGWGEALLALALGAAAVAAAVFLAPALAAGSAVLLSLMLAGLGYLAFRSSGLLLDPLPPIFAMLGGQLGVLAMVVGNMLLRDDAVRGSFHGALPPQTMAKLQSRGGNSLLRGARRQVTVLSCALRLPQRVAARFEGRPDDFVRFTASANDSLRRTILAHGGTVDHAENGQLLGYWNVPEASENHIEHACACALKMIDDVAALSENVQEAAFSGRGAADEGFSEGVIEIGIASGPCFAGPVGVGARNRYAVIGDAVALATRLRARSSLYGPAIVTDDAVYDALRHHYAFLDLDIVRLEGSEADRGVFGLVGNPFLKASKAFRTLADTQRELLLSWKTGDLSAVTAQLQHLRAVPGVPDAYVELFEARLSRARGQDAPRRADDPWTPAETLIL